MNQYNAARSAGYAHNTAIKACNNLEPKIKIEDYLERAGLTDKALAAFLFELFSANKVVGYLHAYKKGEKGRIEEISPDEKISNEFLEVPDYMIRLKASELVLKIKGYLKDKIEHSGKIEGGQPIIIMIPKERQEEYDNRLKGIYAKG